jgi:hypothetical protein
MIEDRRPAYLMRPKPIAVELTEGDCWIPFDLFKEQRPKSAAGKTVHAILFEDGAVWDAVSGWRDTRLCTHCMGNGRLP